MTNPTPTPEERARTAFRVNDHRGRLLNLVNPLLVNDVEAAFAQAIREAEAAAWQRGYAQGHMDRTAEAIRTEDHMLKDIRGALKPTPNYRVCRKCGTVTSANGTCAKHGGSAFKRGAAVIRLTQNWWLVLQIPPRLLHDEVVQVAKLCGAVTTKKGAEYQA